MEIIDKALDETRETLGIVGRFYREYVSKYKWRFFCYCFLMFTFAGLLLTPPFLISLLIDDALTESDMTKVFVYAGCILGAYVLMGIVDKMQGMLGWGVAQQITYRLRKNFYAHLQKMTFSFYDNAKTGELLSRIMDDLNVVQRALYGIPRQIIQNIVTVGLSLALSIYLTRKAPGVALASFVVLPAIFLVFAFYFQRLKREVHKVREKKASMSSKAENALSGIRIVQAFRQESYEEDRFDDENTGHYQKRLAVISYKTSMFPFTLSLMGVSLTIAAAYGGYQVINGPLTVGALTGFIMYLQRFRGPLHTLARITEPASRFLAGIQRFFTYMDIDPDIKDKEDAVDLTDTKGDIEFSDVWFRYEEENILKGINARMEPGETVALVGPSGSGKTTITRLIPRFYEPYQGKIKIDGKNLEDYTLASLRDNIAIVMQSQHLMSDTLKHNIKYGAPQASDERVVAAARKANVDQFARELPNDYETHVGEQGAKLSQGQAQRVAIARAILKDAPILILDEATSSVDSETEQLIQEALDELVTDKTAVVIAHRLSTIRNADKILFIEDGQVVESGTHDELLDSGGNYARFYDLQFNS